MLLLQSFRSFCIGSHCFRPVSIAFGLSYEKELTCFSFLDDLGCFQVEIYCYRSLWDVLN